MKSTLLLPCRSTRNKMKLMKRVIQDEAHGVDVSFRKAQRRLHLSDASGLWVRSGSMCVMMGSNRAHGLDGLWAVNAGSSGDVECTHMCTWLQGEPRTREKWGRSVSSHGPETTGEHALGHHPQGPGGKAPLDGGVRGSCSMMRGVDPRVTEAGSGVSWKGGRHFTGKASDISLKR